MFLFLFSPRNEPDLNAPCMEVAGVTNARKWVEYYIVMSAAINSAFAGATETYLSPMPFLCSRSPVCAAAHGTPHEPA